MSETEARYRKPLLGVTSVIVVWALAGAFDVRNMPYTGYATDPGNTVVSVAAGSPAEAAGVQVGDRIVSIDDTPVEDTRALLRQRRPAVGQPGMMVVARGEDSIPLTIRYGEQPVSAEMLAHATALVGLCFLFFGVSAYLTAAGPKTLSLALAGVGLGFGFASSPYIPNPAWVALEGTLKPFLIFLGLAWLLRFVLSMPRPARLLERPAAGLLLFGPAVLVGGLVGGFLFLQPEATSALNHALQLAVDVTAFGYFAGTLLAVVRRRRDADAAEREAHGLDLMLVGTAVGILPLTIYLLMRLVSPDTMLPGVQYFFLAFGVIPVTFAMAAVRSARATD